MGFNSGFKGLMKTGHTTAESMNPSLSSAQVKNACIYITTTPYAFKIWCVIKYGADPSGRAV